MIFEAQKKLDAAVEVFKKANEDRKAADDYLSKVEATIEAFEKFLRENDGDKKSQIYEEKLMK